MHPLLNQTVNYERVCFGNKIHHHHLWKKKSTRGPANDVSSSIARMVKKKKKVKFTLNAIVRGAPFPYNGRHITGSKACECVVVPRKTLFSNYNSPNSQLLIKRTLTCKNQIALHQQIQIYHSRQQYFLLAFQNVKTSTITPHTFPHRFVRPQIRNGWTELTETVPPTCWGWETNKLWNMRTEMPVGTPAKHVLLKRHKLHLLHT